MILLIFAYAIHLAYDAEWNETGIYRKRAVLTVKHVQNEKHYMQGTSKNPSHGESAESFPPELCSDFVTKILRIGSTIRTDFCLD